MPTPVTASVPRRPGHALPEREFERPSFRFQGTRVPGCRDGENRFDSVGRGASSQTEHRAGHEPRKHQLSGPKSPHLQRPIMSVMFNSACAIRREFAGFATPRIR